MTDINCISYAIAVYLCLGGVALILSYGDIKMKQGQQQNSPNKSFLSFLTMPEKNGHMGNWFKPK